MINQTTNTQVLDSGYILIVDDSPNDRLLLTRILTASGYEVRPVESGRLALSEARDSPPALILLDVTMPEMDGFAVCEQLKAAPEELVREAPVIFISALNATLDKMSAFSVGGVDYITKPYDVKEVLARVETHLLTRGMQKKLQEKNKELQAENARRKRAEEALRQKNEALSSALKQLKATQNELIQTAGMAALGQLITGIAHEIKSPLSSIRAAIGNISQSLNETSQQLPQLLLQLSPEKQHIFLLLLGRASENQELVFAREMRKRKRQLRRSLNEYSVSYPDVQAEMLIDMGVYDNIETFIPLLQEPEALSITKIAYKLANQQRNSNNISLAVEHAIKIVSALKKYARQEQRNSRITTDISQTLDTVLTIYYNRLRYNVEVIRCYDDAPSIPCYPDELNQVWTNLIHNALQAMNDKGTLEIRLEYIKNQNGTPFEDPALSERDYIMVRISDDGPGIPPELQDRIFEPFFTTKPSGEGTGLGLDIVRKIVVRHEGKIEVSSRPGKTTFSVSLPIYTS